MQKHKLLVGLGTEPLGNKFSAARLESAFKGRSASVKNALLNQALIAGIGNIYANEALFLSGISPRRKAGTITGVRADRLATAIVTTLRAAIEMAGHHFVTMFNLVVKLVILFSALLLMCR